MMKVYELMIAIALAALAMGPAVYSEDVADEGGGFSAEEILDRIDKNEVSDTQRVKMKMVIERGPRRRPKELVMEAWLQDRDQAAIEVISGPDKGTRYLRMGDDLWIASRMAEKPMKISGHMLRQSMLDSDMSYEDMMNNKPLRERFEAEIVREDTRDGRAAWVLELEARGPDETYPRQTLWVDRETFLPVRQELKALSGVLLKTMTYSDLKEVQGRWTPMQMIMDDELKDDSSTTVMVMEIEFDVEIPADKISLAFVESVH